MCMSILDWLEEQLVVRSGAGQRPGTSRTTFSRGPAQTETITWAFLRFSLSGDGSPSVAARQCTSKYKVKPINRYLRERLGHCPPGAVHPNMCHVEIWMGISVDEALRQKDIAGRNGPPTATR